MIKKLRIGNFNDFIDSKHKTKFHKYYFVIMEKTKMFTRVKTTQVIIIVILKKTAKFHDKINRLQNATKF